MVIFLGFLIIAAIGVGAFVAADYQRLKEQKQQFGNLKQFEREYREAVGIFELYLDANEYFNNGKYLSWQEQYRHLAYKGIPYLERLSAKDDFIGVLLRFFKYRTSGREVINVHNEKFIAEEGGKIFDFLNSKGRINIEQSQAIASGEDRTLLVAGAGTGKTTTIIGKIRYLTEKLHIAPGEILLLSFNKSVVEELKLKLKDELSGISVYTFHALGLSIIGKVLGRRPDVAFGGDELTLYSFLNEKFEQLLQQNEYQTKVLNYFFFYLKPIEVVPAFANLDQYYQYIKNIKVVTFQKEVVKSQQEAFIANFLYQNNVKYEYEAPYKKDLADSQRRIYKPDFYLPDYDIYIEHFGINREGMVHFSNNEALNAQYSKKYLAEMQFKRQIHQKLNTTLIETYSYEFNENIRETNLTNKLKSRGVQLVPKNPKEIIDQLKEGKYISQFIELCDTFLNLAKSGGFTKHRLQEVVEARDKIHERIFLQLFLPLFDAYEQFLKDNEKIDFHDMLSSAANYVRNNQYISPYRYILIDEFQDFSLSKYHLVKAFCDQNLQVQLFCVGDDWQSIYRFSGADVSLMSNFEELFGFTREAFLEETHRFNDKIAELSNEFILQNPLQIKKRVRSSVKASEKVLEIIYKANIWDNAPLVAILSQLNKHAEQSKGIHHVLLLGRYNDESPKNLKELQKEFKNLQIKFLSMHRSKGLEADYVIILNAIRGEHGFPSEIVDDPLLNIVLSKGEEYPFAEERRLMYVALTRARNKVYILTMKGRESQFVSELQKATQPAEEKETEIICKKCGGKMIWRSSSYGQFMGCRNYPDCDYKITIRRQTRYRRE